MKRIAFLLAIATVAAACSSTVEDGGTGADASVTTVPGSSGEAKAEGPDAPNFTLALASGDSFTLYDEQKPVYMIFWAEW